MTPDAGASLNGVLAPVAASELPELDRRESGYQRVPVDPGAIEVLGGADAGGAVDAAVVYATTSPIEPTSDLPILQSYLDICLEGCFEVEAMLGPGSNFAQDFLATTHGWSRHWVNDRLFPRAPFRYVPQAGRIDRLLRDRCPAEFDAIRIE